MRSACGILALAALTVSPAALGAAEVISGEAQAVDAGTIEINGERIRLHGIQTPDIDLICDWSGKPVECGAIAKAALMDLITGAPVTCEVTGARVQDTVVAVCQAQGFDVGANMVHTGWAFADREVTDIYLAIEDKAKAGRRGLWRRELAGARADTRAGTGAGTRE